MKPTNTTGPESTDELDDMRLLVEAIAIDLWRLFGATGTLNWGEVEHYLEILKERTRSNGRASRAVPFSGAADALPSARLVGRRGNAEHAYWPRQEGDARLPEIVAHTNGRRRTP